MKHEVFQELLESVREGGAILRGKSKAARTFEVPATDQGTESSPSSLPTSQDECSQHTLPTS